MKTLYLIRHAKSDWNNPGIRDFDRPLNKRGIRDAPFMGKKLANLNFGPELIVCSPAKRASTTAKLIGKEIKHPFDNILFYQSIYESSLDNLISLIDMLPDAKNEIALIGHNPGITLLSNYITDEFISNIPTCGIVKIELEIDSWAQIVRGIGIQKYFIYPKAFA